MKIRKAEISDIDKIHEIGKDIPEFNTTDKVVTFWPKYILENYASDENGLFILAEDKEIVGFAITNYNSALKKAIIENIYVHPDYREQKVGQKLLDELMSKLEKIGCEYVCALIETNNEKAVSFYKKLGFNRGTNCAWMDKVLGDRFRKNN